MDNLPFLINRLSPEIFLIIFGAAVLILSSGITAAAYAIARHRYFMRHMESETRYRVESLERDLSKTLAALETERQLNHNYRIREKLIRNTFEMENVT